MRTAGQTWISIGSGPASADIHHKTPAISTAKIKRDKRTCQIPGSFVEPRAAGNEQQSVFIRGLLMRTGTSRSASPCRDESIPRDDFKTLMHFFVFQTHCWRILTFQSSFHRKVTTDNEASTCEKNVNLLFTEDERAGEVVIMQRGTFTSNMALINSSGDELNIETSRLPGLCLLQQLIVPVTSHD